MMKKGFTLAEVLITLGIIGVISALTIPNIIGGYQSKVLVTQLQRTYNLIRSGVVKSLQDEDVSSVDELSWKQPEKETEKAEFLKKYLGAQAFCTSDSGYANCLGSPYYSYDRSKTFELTNTIKTTDEIGQDAHKVVCGVLESGATVCIGAGRRVLMDVNGKQNPNQIGKDVFYFRFNEDGTAKVGDGNLVRSAGSGDDGNQVGTNQQDGAAGKYCFTNGTSVRNSQCLLYVISNGWKIK